MMAVSAARGRSALTRLARAATSNLITCVHTVELQSGALSGLPAAERAFRANPIGGGAHAAGADTQDQAQKDRLRTSFGVRAEELLSPRTERSSPACRTGLGPLGTGFQEVKEEEKQGMVLEVFKKVADNYDLMNDVMSGGLHRIWKDQLVAMLRPAPGCKHLDVAGGTGDVAFRVMEAIRKAERASLSPSPLGHVTVCDINPDMLRVGKDRARRAGLRESQLSWVEGNAEQLPIEDNSMDSYTIGLACTSPESGGGGGGGGGGAVFGLRNCTHVDAVLRDAYRVLKPGGRFLCMEFNKVQNPLLRQAYDAYSFNLIPLMGQVISNDRDSYQYLVESIRKFPEQEVLAEMMEDAEFLHVTYENIVDGAVCIHSGFKL